MQSELMMISCEKKNFKEMERFPKESSKKNSPITKQTIALPGKVFYSNSNSPLVNKSLLTNPKLSGISPPLLSFAGALNTNQSLHNYLILQNQFASVQSNLNSSSPGPSKSKQRNSKTNPKTIGMVKSITDVSAMPKNANLWRFPQPFQIGSLKSSPIQHSKTKDRESSLKKMVQTSGVSMNLLSPATPTGVTRKSNSQGKKKNTQQIIWTNLSRRNKKSLNSQIDPTEEQLGMSDCTNSFGTPLIIPGQTRNTPSRCTIWNQDNPSTKGTPIGNKTGLIPRQPFSKENVSPNLLLNGQRTDSNLMTGTVGRLLLMNCKSQPRVQKARLEYRDHTIASDGPYIETNETAITQPKTPLHSLEVLKSTNHLILDEHVVIIERLSGIKIHKRPLVSKDCANVLFRVSEIFGNMRKNYTKSIEVYDLVKKYVDLAQESVYKQLDQVLAEVKTTKAAVGAQFSGLSSLAVRQENLGLNNPTTPKDQASFTKTGSGERLLAYGALSTSLGIALKLERWAIMIFFYLTFRQLDFEPKTQALLQSILDLLLHNSGLAALILISFPQVREDVLSLMSSSDKQHYQSVLEDSKGWLQTFWDHLEQGTHLLHEKLSEWYD